MEFILANWLIFLLMALIGWLTIILAGLRSSTLGMIIGAIFAIPGWILLLFSIALNVIKWAKHV